MGQLGRRPGREAVRQALIAMEEVGLTALAAALVDPALPSPLGFVDRVFLLHGLALLAGAEMQALANLAEQAEEIALAAGDALDPHHVNDALHVVVSGQITASVPGGTRVRTYGPGRLVFGNAAAGAKDLGHDTRAGEGTRVLLLVREDFYDVLEEHFAIARSTLRALATEREVLVDEKEAAGAGWYLGDPQGG